MIANEGDTYLEVFTAECEHVPVKTGIVVL